MERRSLLAVLAALGALAVAVGVVALGATCGYRSVSATCGTTEECASISRCEPFVHPLAWPFVALALVGVAAAWRDRPLVALGAAVLAGGLSTILGFSIGGLELAGALLLLASGWFLVRTKRERRHAAGAVAAVLAGVPTFMLVATLGVRSLAVVWLAFFAPALIWLALAALTARKGSGAG